MKYFTNITTIEELKKAYRILIKKHHPDNGGDTKIAAAINNEYENLFNALKAEHNTKATADTTGNTKEMHETPEQFRAIIEKIIHLDGITIELCDSWIWVSGDTKTHKDVFKAAGMGWAKQKEMWFWRCAEDASKTKKTATMDHIRTKYGSDTVSPKRQPALAV